MYEGNVDYYLTIADNTDFTATGTYTVTAEVHDTSLNYNSLEITITIVDTIAPTFDSIPEQTIEALAYTNIDWTTYILNEADNSLGTLTKVEVTDNVDYGVPGTYSVTVKVVDESLNETSLTFTVLVVDTILPTVTYNGPLEFDVYSQYPDFSSYVTCVDNLDGDCASSVLIDEVGIDFNTPSEYILGVYGSDSSGNSVTLYITIEVIDTIAPVITLTGDAVIYVEYLGVYTEQGATCIDNSDITCTVVISGDTVDNSMLGTYEITYNATDDSGNAAIEVIRTVIVQDTEIPVITLSGDAEIYLEYGDTYREQGANDTVNTNQLGVYTVTYNINDISGNAAVEVTRTVIVQDTTPPTFDTIDDQIIEVGSYTDIDWTTYILNEADNSNGTLTKIEVTDNVDYGVVGTYTVTVSVNDEFGNTTSQTFNVEVVDTEAPTFNTIPNQTFEVGVGPFDWTMVIANAADNSNGVLTKVEVIDNVDYDTPGIYSVTVKVSDIYGNSLSQTFDVEVVDTTAPTFDTIPEQTIEAGLYTDINWSNLIVNTYDASDGTLTKVEVVDNVDYDTVGTYTVTVSLLDESLNETLQTFNVIVEDTTGPTYEIIIEAGRQNIDWSSYISNQNDNSDGDLTAVEVIDNIDYDTPGTYTVTVKLVDESQNETLQTFKVTVEDTISPTFDSIEDQILAVNGTDIDWTTFITNVVENSDGVLTKIETIDNVLYDVVGTYTVTVKVIDESLNESSYTFNVTIEDKIAPIATLIGEATIYVEYNEEYTELGVTCTDNYDTLCSAIISGDVVNTTILGTYVIAYSVTDSEGNTGEVITRVVEVRDTTAPEIIIGEFEETIELGVIHLLSYHSCTDNYDSTCSVDVINNINTNLIGDYTVEYSSIDSEGNEQNIIFNISVVDTISPTVILNASLDSILVGGNFVDYGVLVDDFADTFVSVEGSIDANTPGTYLLTYAVRDASNNETVIVRYVTISEQQDIKVKFILGTADTSVEVGGTYFDGTCKVIVNNATYNCDVKENNVDTTIEGIQVVTYSYTHNGIEYTYKRYVFVYYNDVPLTLYFRKEEELS